MKNILVTGSAGYIGSVCTYRLLKEGYTIYAFDNLSTGNIETIEKLKKFGNLIFIEGDLRNYSETEKVFENKIDSVIHFAALSQVEESQEKPLVYFENNVLGSVNLFKAMIKNNVKKLVFSSTAAIYGNPEYTPIDEIHPKNPINIYGETKLTIEKILEALDATNGLKSISLRYFNACGASDDCLFGELHNPETHLIPNILKANNLKIYGDNYKTKDGTCIRDYIDVEDISDAHILALKYLDNNNETLSINLGSKEGYSVFDIIKICEETLNQKIKYDIHPKRMADVDVLIANNSKAKNILGWNIKRNINQSIKKACNYLKDAQ